MKPLVDWGEPGLGVEKEPEKQLALDDVTESIIGCAYVVSNVLGAGYLEKVYENALAHEI